jgi:hypothetical protein
MMDLLQFVFIVVLPIVIVGGGLASLFAVGALFDALEDPQALRTRIDSAFKPSTRPARAVSASHYYRPHWLGGKPTETPAP